jgi:hypothetical protein
MGREKWSDHPGRDLVKLESFEHENFLTVDSINDQCELMCFVSARVGFGMLGCNVNDLMFTPSSHREGKPYLSGAKFSIHGRSPIHLCSIRLSQPRSRVNSFSSPT